LALFLAASTAQADGLLYQPGDILIAVRSNGGLNSFDGVVSLDPDTLLVTPLAQGDLLDAGGIGGTGPSGVALEANGDILVIFVPPAGGAHVVRVDGKTASQSPVATTAEVIRTEIYPARIGGQLFINTGDSISAVDLATGSTSLLTSHGFLTSDSTFVTAESDTTLLTSGNQNSGQPNGSLVHVALDTQRQSLGEYIGFSISGAAMMGSTPFLSTGVGVIELDPILGPTRLAPVGGPGIGIFPDGSLAVNEGSGNCSLARLRDPYTQPETLLNGLPGEICTGWAIVPAPEPSALLLSVASVGSLLAIARRRRVG
jgi:hypothetical protein